MSVRVVAPGPCETCKGGKWLYSDGTPAVNGFKRNTFKCGVCRGTGTVERDVSCRDCVEWHQFKDDEGWCGLIQGQPTTHPDFACKAWEPRSTEEVGS